MLTQSISVATATAIGWIMFFIQLQQVKMQSEAADSMCSLALSIMRKAWAIFEESEWLIRCNKIWEKGGNQKRLGCYHQNMDKHWLKEALFT